MAHYVKCYYCSQTFDRDKGECLKVNGNRYAHNKCHQLKQQEKSQEEKELEALEEYIKKLFNTDYINPRIRKQIKDFREQHHYTYTGIHKALMYFYDVKKNSIEKANGGIGIVPYVYQNAYEYYYKIWLANQQNKAKPVEQYQPQERVIVIPPPKRIEKKKKLFVFLDEEV